MKSGLSTLLKFTAGSAFGATIGATIAVLMAPKSGEQTQAETSALFNTMKTEGENARQDAENRMADRFRQKVNDPDALKQ